MILDRTSTWMKLWPDNSDSGTTVLFVPFLFYVVLLLPNQNNTNRQLKLHREAVQFSNKSLISNRVDPTLASYN